MTGASASERSPVVDTGVFAAGLTARSMPVAERHRLLLNQHEALVARHGGLFDNNLTTKHLDSRVFTSGRRNLVGQKHGVYKPKTNQDE